MICHSEESMKMILTHIPSSEYHRNCEYPINDYLTLPDQFCIPRYNIPIHHHTCITRIYIWFCASIWDFYIMSTNYYHRIWHRMMACRPRMYHDDMTRTYGGGVLSQSQDRFRIRTLPSIYYFYHSPFG